MSEISSIDGIIAKLLAVRNSKSCKVHLPSSEIRMLCLLSRDVFMSQPMLLDIPAPVKICGDIHGQYADLLRLFELGGFPDQVSYLFLGDYVDRGDNSVETMCLLLAFKVKFPKKFFLLRGNHESINMNKDYGFLDECKRRYSKRTYADFSDVFDCMPVAAIVASKMFCCHGGLSPELVSMQQILQLTRPCAIPGHGLMCDLLWADPRDDIMGWGESYRGISYTFGNDVVAEFLKMHGLEAVCRAHEMIRTGFRFSSTKQLITMFSAPNYCDESNNGAIMSVGENLNCTFQILGPDVRRS